MFIKFQGRILSGLMSVLAAVLMFCESVFAGADPVGKLVGVVRFAGPYPKPKKIRLLKDVEACGSFKYSQKYIVAEENKGLKNAVITIEGLVNENASPTQKLVVDQRDCIYVPHLQVALLGPKGIDLVVLNNDGIFHNVHGYLDNVGKFNLVHPPDQEELHIKLTEPGILNLKCDMHPWMSAYVIIMKGKPYYAVTDEKGSFTIDNVPAGTYTVKMWHEGVTSQTKQVSIKAGEETRIEFLIKPRKKKRKAR